jgi:hypothetical protein
VLFGVPQSSCGAIQTKVITALMLPRVAFE